MAWGHTSVVDPWGKVIATTEEMEDVIVADIDLDHMAQVRQQVPITMQKRTDLYETVKK